jgi:hypothetical protein
MHAAISRAAGVGGTSARFSGKRAWSGCYIQKIDAALKSYCIKERFNGQRRNWRKEVAIGLCQVVMVLTFKGTESFCVLRLQRCAAAAFIILPQLS